MGTEAAYLVIKSLKEADTVNSTLREFYCNFNEITAPAISRSCLDILLGDEFKSLEYVEFRGNTLPRKHKLEYVVKYEKSNRKVVLFEEEDDEGDDEEEEEEEQPEFEEDDIVAKLTKLKL